MDLLTLEFSRGPLNTLPHFDPWHPTCIVFVTLKRYRSKYFKIYACRNKCNNVILTHNSITHDAFLRE